MSGSQIKFIFFDLGDTLVQRVSITPIRFQWITGAAELVKRLRQAGIPLGLISNTGDLSRAQLTSMLPSDFDFDFFETDAVILSSEVGIEKPDLRIFRMAISQAQSNSSPANSFQLDPHNCLFVGESLKEVVAAQQVGMMGACVQHTSQSAMISGLDPLLNELGLLG